MNDYKVEKSPVQRITFYSIDQQLDAIGEGGRGLAGEVHAGRHLSQFGTATYEEASALARDGWAGVRKQVDGVLDLVRERVSSRLAPTYDYRRAEEGSSVNMSAYMNGEPECMIYQHPTPTRKGSKVVKVLYNTGALWHATGDGMTRRGIAMIAMIDTLETLGARVELWVECSGGNQSNSSECGTILTRIKEAHEVVDVNRIMFVLANPAWHRRISWNTRARFMIAGRRCGSNVLSRPLMSRDVVDADIVVAESHDNNDHRGRDPVAWILSTLKDLGFEVSDS